MFPLLSVRTVKQLALCAILLVMPIRSPVLANRARSSISSSLADQPQVRTALDWLSNNLKWIDDAQVRLTEIPAPSFREEKRAEAVRDMLATEGLTIHTDKIGNVIGELPGSDEREVVVLAAHLDTVFPAGTCLLYTSPSPRD